MKTTTPEKVTIQTRKHDNRNIKYFVETYGCQMNEYDSGIVQSILKDCNYSQAQDQNSADIILLNTCAVREKAHEKVYNRLSSFAGLKKKKPDLIIGILGCMAQNLGDDLFAQGLPVDFVLGPDNYKSLPGILSQSRTNQSASINLTQLSRSETYSDIEPGVVSGPLSFVTIMRGCDNFCSFCVVPFTRGRERSLDPDSIVLEINNLIDRHDVKEITLLGQNVNSYKYNAINFTNLISIILSNTKINRIRFTSPHPHDFPIELLELMAREERFCNQIHLPLQSGSSSVLKRMKRDYNQSEFIELVGQIRKIIPDAGLSTDIITGFCGETEDEFEDTLHVVNEIQFDMAFMFHYSQREMTSAYKNLPDDISKEIKINRLQRLIELQSKISLSKNQAKINTYQVVLVESLSKRSPSHLMGRNSAGKAVVFKAPEAFFENPQVLIGTFQKIHIDACTSATLQGHINPAFDNL